MIVILKQKADAGRKKLIPEKSGERYHKEMEIFRNWRQINGAEKIDEDVMLAYVSELSKKYDASSVSTEISMVETMLLTYENVDISSYSVVKSFMKRNSSEYVPKMSYVL
ncbi:hypothetical protein MTP99_004871 [Tenebrio molitor]|nr:hypothetical protein MTP99_004871 [Tenebrio molitor]